MKALALAVLLAALPTRPWLERDATAVVVSVDLRPMFDEALRSRLTNGLTTTLRLRVELRDLDDALVGIGWRVARVRWDLWDETLAAVIEDPGQATATTYVTLDAFIARFAQLERVPLATGVPREARVVQTYIRLEVNPVDAEKLARMRRWLSAPASSTVLDPFGSGLLGSFVRLFDNLKPGAAERVIGVDGQAVRLDRLPLVEEAGGSPAEGGDGSAGAASPPDPAKTADPAPPVAPTKTEAAPPGGAPEPTPGGDG